MTHQARMIAIFRFGISKIQGADSYFSASFETQFQNLIKGGLGQDFGTNLNNYTSYILNQECQTGASKNNIILSQVVKEAKQVVEVIVKTGQLNENNAFKRFQEQSQIQLGS
jgi:hypothetical protein